MPCHLRLVLVSPASHSTSVLRGYQYASQPLNLYLETTVYKLLTDVADPQRIHRRDGSTFTVNIVSRNEITILFEIIGLNFFFGSDQVGY